MNKIDNIVLSCLVQEGQYLRKVLPFVVSDYFDSYEHKTIFRMIRDYVDQYNVAPSKEFLELEIQELETTQDNYDAAKNLVKEIYKPEERHVDTWVDKTEQWCKDRAIYNAICKAAEIVDGSRSNLSVGAIPEMMTEALAVGFDTDIGHDFFNDAESRYEKRFEKTKKLPWGIKLLDEATNGGVEDGTVNIFIAGPNVGKSMVMCHFAAEHLMMGKNVLYISMEMSQEMVADRIEANLLDLDLSSLDSIGSSNFTRRIDKLRKQTAGALKIKQYPTAGASVNNFRALMQELKIKQSFVPDVIYVDYLNICASARFKQGSSLYEINKSIAEELRGFAIEYELPIFTATQTNRQGYANSDLDISETAESFGIPATADFMLAIIRSDEMDELNQLMFKQLKSRYGDKQRLNKFVVGVERSKQRLYNVEDSAQDIVDSYRDSSANTNSENNFKGFT